MTTRSQVIWDLGQLLSRLGHGDDAEAHFSALILDAWDRLGLAALSEEGLAHVLMDLRAAEGGLAVTRERDAAARRSAFRVVEGDRS